jgi:hypothetical protein
MTPTTTTTASATITTMKHPNFFFLIFPVLVVPNFYHIPCDIYLWWSAATDP